MTGENNKKGCNNKILISTWMLVSMVCMLSVSDMLGMEPSPQRIDPDEAMKKINKNKETSEAFMKIFKDHKNLIKRNCCCCGDIDIKRTKLPTTEEKGGKASVDLGYYIMNRFTLNKEGGAEVDKDWAPTMGTCKAFDDLILSIYKAPSAS